jgi:YfiH family protein
MSSFQQNPLGFEWLTEDIYLLFGNQNLNRSTYKSDIETRMSAKLNFHYVNQVHGDGIQIIEHAKAQPEEADAMLSNLNKSALVIKTADCLPIFIFDKKQKKIAAIHAGWRGVLNDICLKAIRLMDSASFEDLDIFIGPHIHSQSFQVQEDLIKLFKSKFPFIKEPTHFVKDLDNEAHYFMNLERILKDRLFHECKQALNIQSLAIDTFTNDSFHSYRRDKEAAGRNLSLIFLR